MIKQNGKNNNISYYRKSENQYNTDLTKNDKKRECSVDVLHTSGFTLIEMLIVVAIIAILIAIAIPIFSAQIEKTKEATCTYNKTAFSRHIILDQQLGTVYDTAMIESLYKPDGYAALSKYYCPYDTKKLGYKIQTDSNGKITLFCPYHDGNLTTVGKKYYAEVTGGNVGEILWEALEELAKKPGSTVGMNSSIHSGAMIGENNYTGKVVDDYLKANGLDAEGEKIGELTKSWAVLGNEKAVFWSWVDISNNNMIGKPVPILKYNSSKGTYTVMTTTVVKHTHTNGSVYNVLTENGGGSEVTEIKKFGGHTITQTSEDKNNADKQLELYNEIWEAYNDDPDDWARKVNK